MLSSSPTLLARSSLELMLESLQKQDEKPKDLPPALPSRPTSRARLPSARRSLPVNFRVNEEVTAVEFSEVKRKSDEGRVPKISNTFGRKKIKYDQLNENSPYSSWIAQEMNPGKSSGTVAAVASTSRPAVDWSDSIGYFMKKGYMDLWRKKIGGTEGLLRKILSIRSGESVVSTTFWKVGVLHYSINIGG